MITSTNGDPASYRIAASYLALSLVWFRIDLLDDSTSRRFYWPILGAGLGLATGVLKFGGLLKPDWEQGEQTKYLRRPGSGVSTAGGPRRLDDGSMVILGSGGRAQSGGHT